MHWWQLFIRLSKVVILLWLLWVIYARFSTLHFETDVKQNILITLNKRWHWLLPALLLMPINWLLEMRKWQYLLRISGGISFAQSCRSVLGGLSIGFATPARLGEFAGRLLFLPTQKRPVGLYLSALGGLAQSAVTCLVALPFLCRLLQDMNTSYAFAFPCVALAGLVFLFAFFFFEKIVTQFHRVFPSLKKYVSELNLGNEKTLVLLLSAMRYVVYALQYALLYRMVGVHDSWSLLVGAVSLQLLLQTFLPAIPMADVSMRGGFSLIVFSAYQDEAALIFLVPIVLWFINLMLPALLGYIFILQLKEET